MLNWLEYLPFIIIATLVRVLPRGAALSLGKGLGTLGRLLQPKRVSLTFDNLSRAFPEKTDTELNSLVKEVFANIGMGFVDMLRLDMYSGQEDLDRYFTIEGEENLREALELGRGCILLVGHVGFWEAGNFFMPQLGFAFEVVAKPMRNPLVDTYFRKMREAKGTTIIDSRKGARRILKALQKNHSVAILMDQHIKKSEAVEVPFFNRPAHTTPITAQLAMKYQIPVVSGFVYRNPDNTYHTKLSPMVLLEGDVSKESVVENTALLSRMLEDGIRENIGQWFWLHRRWRD
jgi:KDO2-lipid IV(A) lauroyltransferase